ncbi:MAG: class I SAM-dependent methyltransferase [Gammaproteobacteria bacterium]|nr:class I SAM-dependent methyltransferase [Gammaproteobacteria bacterium]
MNYSKSTIKVLANLIAGLSLLHFSDNVTAENNKYSRAEQLVNHPARLKLDLTRDASRNPVEVLTFYDIRPGMKVLDVFAGGGYYTELFSYAVGSTGKVVAHNNQAYVDYVNDTLSKRFQPDRLNNVERLVKEANEIELAANSFDMAFLILAFHDIYYRPKKGGWPKIDRKDFLNRIYVGLKPGGVLGVIDHHAKSGSPETTGDTLHRIDVDLVIAQLREAGFILKERAYFLENEQDDLSKHMYAPDTRGKTSRFVLKFIKPLEIDQQLVEERNFP